MITHAHTKRWTYRLGRSMGRTWRGYVSRERHVADWIISRGVPAVGASVLIWLIKLVLLGLLLYAAFWLALLLVFAVAAAWVAEHSMGQDESDFLGRKAEELDHRDSLSYNPYNYNDDPDPRFEDD
ncbi:DUF3742 family protein [Sodalis sp. RH20]